MPPVSLVQRFALALEALAPPDQIAVAVSGGSDSMALLHLAHRWGAARLHVVSVDHRLRPEAAQEAAMVARAAHALDLPHVTLHWQGWDGQGNLQDTARKARQTLLADWARQAGLPAILLGHTRDDQAETVLMRLARGSGVDGLAGMAAARDAHGVQWLRPLLDIGREDLRDWLRAQGVAWIDDPGNDDQSYDRVKARHALTHLAPMGVSAIRLAETAQRMAQARDVLDMAASAAAQRLCRIEYGDIVFDASALDALPAETRNRLVAQALCAVSSNPYRPRLSALRSALSASRSTLHGALLTRGAQTLRITREFRAVRDHVTPADALWDGRWTLTPPDGMVPPEGAQIRALGAAGLALCADRNSWRLPRHSLLASPSLWQGDQLVAAPLADIASRWRASAVPVRGVLARAPNSH